MGLLTKKILKITITIAPKEQILEEIKKYLAKSKIESQKLKVSNIKPLIIFTPNPEIINFAQKDSNFKQIVNSAQINIPDGWGVSWGIRKLSGLSVKKLSGTDFMLELCQLAVNKGARVGLIGGRGGVALATSECLREKYPGLKIRVFETPENEIQISKFKKAIKEPEERYFESLAKTIKEKKIDILFVALGCPKQEYFIEKVKFQMSRPKADRPLDENVKYDRPLVLMAVGGAFDYMRGAEFFWKVINCQDDAKRQLQT